MSGGRSGKPLFELLRDGPDQPADAPARPEPTPAPSTRTPGVRSLQVPLSTLYISAALVLGLVLLAWVGGHKFGLEQGRREMASAAVPDTLADLVINDPIADRRSLNDEADPVALDGSESPAAEPPLTPVAPQREGEIIAATGMLVDDPREPLVNYLVLATLDEGSAAEAVQFLATRGIEAIAVPTGTAGVYRVVSLDSPVPSGRFRELADVRRELEARVRACGQEWLRGHGGSSDFSATMWALYEP
ncbi:MAG: hypothetical protein RIB32_02045 [Phycisphaerales bacterium]